MTATASPTPIAAAPVVAADRATLRYDGDASLDCVYVQIDARGRSDITDFLAGWSRCCDEVLVDWHAVRRPLSALVGFELRHCCGDPAAVLRIVFDVRRDLEVLEALAATESIVVGSRRFGAFANSIVAYPIDGRAVRLAIRAATSASGHNSAIAS